MLNLTITGLTLVNVLLALSEGVLPMELWGSAAQLDISSELTNHGAHLTLIDASKTYRVEHVRKSLSVVERQKRESAKGVRQKQQVANREVKN